MSISAKDVKELREVTGAGMMDCKKALSECGGDKEKAIDFLRTKGLAAAAKKQSRVAAEGLIGSFVNGGKNGCLVEVNCETDFVAKNDDFKNFVHQISEFVSTNNFNNNDELLAADFNGQSVSDLISELTLKIGEKIAFRRFFKFDAGNSEFVGSYIHTGKIGVLVKVAFEGNAEGNADFQNAVKDVCMHIAASDTKFINAEDMDQNYVDKEAEIYAAQLKEQGKPENMIPNIVKGKINKLASEVCLLKQKFVKNPDQSVEQFLNEFTKSSDIKINVLGFEKYTLGEGIEKREDNLADEVAKMTGGN
jgi:elongation factor Ts